ncbi:hypothetical protein PPERSA_00816 [Pseudocohnilembus persalinus]|uniref:Uncharacterized protein n=1 Tax=Pseudocohnilembus persalinus TaxID=266149 RepID=A0A0V0QFX0_PSEPJ|nr:hypothetical protein PPERSA_00816 [Pseudocohnilembus persalinus]|eukprot:KRX01068.1 hypothetical protein PPERSA_00816 [Pseudocohnilembus persalinus]
MAEIQQQTQQFQAGKQSVPKIDFPEMKCSIHRSPINFVCGNPEQKNRIFLCSRCVTSELENIKNFEPLIVYEDFVKFLSESTGLNSTPSEEAKDIVKSKSSNISQFNDHITQQKFEITQTVKQLNDKYQNKCSELAASLQEVLEEQKDIYADNYNKFEKEVEADYEKDAEMPKFHEIKSTIQGMNDLSQIEDYMRNIFRKKQQWKEASIQLRTIGIRSQDFYRDLVEGQGNKKPTFDQAEYLIEYWNNGLEKLISEIKRKSNCFSNMFQSSEGITLQINQLQELQLLTNKMVKPDTQIRLIFGGHKLTNELAEQIGSHLAALTNLKHLFLDFSQASISEETLTILLDQVKTLTGLTYLEFSCYGSKNKNIAAICLAKVLSNFVNLNELRLNFSFSDLHCQGAAALAEGITTLTQLTILRVDFSQNQIKEEGAKAWGASLEKLTNLEILQLNFGGFSNIKNRIKDEGATFLIKSLRFMPRLQDLELDLGYTGLHNSFTLEFALSVKELQNLKSVNIQFYNNGLTEKGGKKISKTLSKLANAEKVILNLNNNDLKKDGVREVIDGFRRNSTVQNLTLFLRNTGVSKEDSAIFKSNLTHGRNFKELNLHF